MKKAEKSSEKKEIEIEKKPGHTLTTMAWTTACCYPSSSSSPEIGSWHSNRAVRRHSPRRRLRAKMRTAACCRRSSSGSHPPHSLSLVIIIPSDACRIWGTALLSLLLGVAWDINGRGQQHTVTSPRPLLPHLSAITTCPPPSKSVWMEMTTAPPSPPSSWSWSLLASPLANQLMVMEVSSAVATEVSEDGTHLAGTLQPPRWPPPLSVSLAPLLPLLLQGTGQFW